MSRRVNRKRRRVERQLPASFQAAWGIEAPSDKGPKPSLSLPRIVEAAVKIASADGLGAVSMSRVASELGVATMSLYRYVSAKDELLALMMDAAFETPPAPAEPKEGWRRALSRWARQHLAVLRRHPWVVRVPLSGPPILPNVMVWFERGLGCLSGTGLSEREKLFALLLVNGFVRNEALLASDQMAARTAGAPAKAAMSSYGGLLSRLLDPQRFPAISGVVNAGVFEGSDEPDAEFAFGLERILDGVATLISDKRVVAGRR
jgi:AcrR family transcriptional regulator